MVMFGNSLLSSTKMPLESTECFGGKDCNRKLGGKCQIVSFVDNLDALMAC